MDYSLHLYRDVRRHLSDVLRPCREEGARRIAIFALEGGGTFLDMRVRGLDECPLVAFDRLIVVTLDWPDPIVARLVDAGVPAAKLVTLQPTRAVEAAEAVL